MQDDGLQATSAVQSLGQKHSWGIEVQKTFIHYTSPLRTVTIKTPPRTEPRDFAPKVVRFEEEPHTPASMHDVATPSTVGSMALRTVAVHFPCVGSAMQVEELGG